MNHLLKISLLFLFFCGCEKLSDKVSQDGHLLPPNAQNIEYLNDKWGKFELDGQSYYFSRISDQASWVYFPANKKEEPQEFKKEPIRFKCPSCGSGIVLTDLGPVHEIK